jgi:hypothetical protein
MPSVLDVAHDGWLCTIHLLYNSNWKIRQLAAARLLSGQPVYGTERGRRYSPPITYKSHLPGQSPPDSQAGRRVGPAL